MDILLYSTVEIIWCRIPNPRNPDQLLVETERIYTDGTKRPVGKILGGKRRPLEAISSAAKRVINKEMTLEDGMVRIDEVGGMDRREQGECISFGYRSCDTRSPDTTNLP